VRCASSQPLELFLMTQIRMLGLSGSLRRASNSTAVLRGLQDALRFRAALDIFPLHAIPLSSWHVGRPKECARLGVSALRAVGAENQAGTDDDNLARLHRRCTRAAVDERDARVDTCTSCFSAPDRDRRSA